MIDKVALRVFEIPTDRPESDGTLDWNHTTAVVVTVESGGARGLGYTYSHPAAAKVIERPLAGIIEGGDPLAIGELWRTMRDAVRNVGARGIAASAIAAVDAALWDLKARLLGVSLVELLGPVRPGVPIYGSGGFTSQSTDELCAQLAGWIESGVNRVKMKVGRDPAGDPDRVRAARAAIGDGAELFVDANGAYTTRLAIEMAGRFAGSGVCWFEEPVTSDDLDGLRRVRDRAPASMAVTAGEYCWDPIDAERMLGHQSVDVLQVDATRCLGITGVLEVGALCAARSMPLSLHTAPALHAHVGAALARLEHLEYFHDHVRVESILFDGLPARDGGLLVPDRRLPGNNLSVRETEARRYER